MILSYHNTIISYNPFSLDFLRKSRELSEWYGPGFFFVANPLMLPMNVFAAYDKVGNIVMMMMMMMMMETTMMMIMTTTIMIMMIILLIMNVYTFIA